MEAVVVTGLYGKLPAHGDFVYRNLPSEFISVWDEWLQHYIASSKDQLGDEWLDIYLTSPIWRFVFSEGVVDESSWGGIVVPSVDRIGRYFPISIVTKLPSKLNPLEFLLSQNNWFTQIEEDTLEALSGDLTADDLLGKITSIDLTFNTAYSRSESIKDNKPVIINMNFEEPTPTSASTCILDSVLLKSVSSYSAWTTTGSEYVEPSLFFSQGLPPISGIPAMLNGQWAQADWQQPYQLNTEIVN
ncbi:MAG: type VI secretion system-associated protein TagF [Thiohalomonadales bacterium]